VHTQITDADVLIILVSRILFNLRTDRKSLWKWWRSYSWRQSCAAQQCFVR